MPVTSTQYRCVSTEYGYNLTGIVSATWSVGSIEQWNPSFEKAFRDPSLTTDERVCLEAVATADGRPCGDRTEPPRVLPGDVCTLLRDDNPFEMKGTTAATFAFLVHRFWRFEDGIPSTRIIWLRVENVDSAAQHSQNDRETVQVPNIIATQTVESVVVVDMTHTSPPSEYLNTVKSYGQLEDGTNFVVYRILLYCDDFKKSSQLSPKGSAGGYYFLPRSLPPEQRRSTSAVRIISLTPPGVSTDEVLHYIVQDLVTASVNGIEGYTPSGVPIKIFLDVVGFIGDYPASSQTIDTIGHVGRAPCTLCTFRRTQEVDNTGTKFGYTTEAHTNNSTFQTQTS